MPVIPVERLPHTIVIQTQVIQFSNVYNWYGPMSGVPGSVSALVTPLSSKESVELLGYVPAKMVRIYVQPTVTIARDDKITWSDTGDIFRVWADPQKYADPTMFPVNEWSHIEFEAVKEF